MVKKTISIALLGLTIPLLLIKLGVLIVGSSMIDVIWRWLSPFNLNLSLAEFGHILLTAIITSIMAYLVYTDKIKFLARWLK